MARADNAPARERFENRKCPQRHQRDAERTVGFGDKNASDEQQLLGATAQGRAIFTYNIRDFIVLGERYPHHAGIILARQKRMSLNELINALDFVLRETDADEWIGQTRWLNDWRK